MEAVASLSQGRTAAAQCGLFTHKSVPVIFESPFILVKRLSGHAVGLVSSAVQTAHDQQYVSRVEQNGRNHAP